MKTSMKRLSIVGALASMCLAVQGVAAQTATARMVTAANGFLSSLDAQQRARVL